MEWWLVNNELDRMWREAASCTWTPRQKRWCLSQAWNWAPVKCVRSSAISSNLFSNFSLCSINDTLKQHINQMLTYHIWGSSSGTAEDSSLLWCDTMSLGDKLSESWRITVPSPSGSSSPKKIFFFSSHVTSAAVPVKPWVLCCRIPFAHVPYCWGGLQTRTCTEH
jgi:hypothetical protein